MKTAALMIACLCLAACSRRAEMAHEIIVQEIFPAALENFKRDVGRYPTQEEGLQSLLLSPAGVDSWRGPYLACSSVPRDPWRREFIYRVRSSASYGYELLCLGPDGIESSDDVRFSKKPIQAPQQQRP